MPNIEQISKSRKIFNLFLFKQATIIWTKLCLSSFKISIYSSELIVFIGTWQMNRSSWNLCPQNKTQTIYSSAVHSALIVYIECVYIKLCAIKYRYDAPSELISHCKLLLMPIYWTISILSVNNAFAYC